MLGHCARSVGGALPGGGFAGFFRQLLISATGTTTVPVPTGAAWVFAEGLGIGGIAGSNTASGGGAGSDAIFEVTEGSNVTVFIDTPKAGNGTSQAPTTVSYGGTTRVSAASNGSIGGTGAGVVAGKYPSTAASGTTPGRGGGRLAAAAYATNDTYLSPGYGQGGTPVSSGAKAGGRGVAALNFFGSYDDALAFANALYGGNWQP